MTNTPQGMSEEELRKGLSKIRDKIIESANDGYSESINDEDYYDKPLFDLITQYSLTKQLEARIDELENRLRVQFIPSHWERLRNETNSWAKYVDRRISELKHQLGKDK